MDIDDVHPRERTYIQGMNDPRETTALEYMRDARQDRKDPWEMRRSQDSRAPTAEMDDPRRLSRSKEDWGDRRDRDEQGYRKTGQSSIREAVMEPNLPDFDGPHNSTLSGSGSRSHKYFLPREGINHEVIVASIGKYLGPETTCRQGLNREARTSHWHAIAKIRAD
jgi:hypothetical protein